MQRFKNVSVLYALPFVYTKCTARLGPKLVLLHTSAESGPKFVVILHPSAESGRLSSNSLSPEFKSLALPYVHADNFINDCAYGSIGFIILDMSCEYIFMHAHITAKSTDHDLMSMPTRPRHGIQFTHSHFKAQSIDHDLRFCIHVSRHDLQFMHTHLTAKSIDHNLQFMHTHFKAPPPVYVYMFQGTTSN